MTASLVFPRQLSAAFFCLLLLFSVSGCKLFQKLGKKNAGEAEGIALAEEIQANELDFAQLNLSGKAMVQLPEETEFGKNISLSYRIQIIKDSLILVRVSKLIELAKILIRPDSVIVLDKFNQNYYACDYSLAQKFTGLESSFDIFQALLLGDYHPIPAEMQIKGAAKADPLVMTGVYKETQMEYFLNRDLRKLVQIHASRDTVQTDIYYQNFETVGQQSFPMEIRFDVSGASDALQLIHRRASAVPISSVNFKVPESYARQECPQE